ncbi:cryptochrome/photolyase family protein [Saccharomonospora saliphila]|uniref:cryptochrome/photolyase family protein n=1 Tax=Saccharomonospora saliphila TaxID=369829 RepID=UPI0003750001|nr:deoxyribodipyrimidine photo-lyase [Saccharomonospora saliphila]
MRVSLVLFTRDLRVHDNPALRAAADDADRVIPLFVVDSRIVASGYPGGNRAAFLARCLADLDAGLRALGGRLVVRTGDPVRWVRTLVDEHAIRDVHLSDDVSGHAQRRLARLRAELDEAGARVHAHTETITAVAPARLSPSGGQDHFAVFTPYLRRWLETPLRSVLAPPDTVRLPGGLSPGALPGPEAFSSAEATAGTLDGGERAARTALAAWAAGPVDDYAEGHDDLAGDRTSHLSPHLHLGTLSAVEVLHRVGSRTPGAREFTRQLAWRDFHHQVLAARPACARQDYRPRGDRWRDAPAELRAWQEGRTGFPIVDAGMRQLLRQGWMHNRARLITASFLTKTLYLDWRAGARHYLRHLLDGDIANNQLNWQWVAGTGTDSRPNRVLNPLRQAERYDPDGAYVRRHLPELGEITGPEVHRPWTLSETVRSRLDYPEPMVDLAGARERFLAARR